MAAYAVATRGGAVAGRTAAPDQPVFARTVQLRAYDRRHLSLQSATGRLIEPLLA